MKAESHELHCIWRETINRLDTFRQRVQENKDVMAASEFCRWLLFSGLIKLFKNNAQDGFLKVDGSLLESKIQTLLGMCNDRFRTNNQDPSFERTQIESLNEKIDRMAGYLSRLSVAPAVTVASVQQNGETSPKTISGGIGETLHKQNGNDSPNRNGRVHAAATGTPAKSLA